MAQKMTLRYFYGNDADQYSFYRIPKLLFTNEYFKGLSSDAKILYGLMLDRMSLSIKNHWFDDKNRAYIYFSIEDIMELLNCGKNKAVKSLSELDDENGIGLVEKRRQGFGKANIIYVKSFLIEEESEEKVSEKPFQANSIPGRGETGSETKKFTGQTAGDIAYDTEVYNVNFRKFENQTSRIPENKLQEVYISNPNYTYISDTEDSDTSYHILSYGQEPLKVKDQDTKRYDGDLDMDEIKGTDQRTIADTDSLSDSQMDRITFYQDLVRKNIEYEVLINARQSDRELIRQICDLIVEIVLSRNEEIVVASCVYPGELVRSRFLKLRYEHILYVLDCLDRTTTKVKNIRKYLMAALFNAPVTIEGYYRAEVNHDIHRGAIGL